MCDFITPILLAVGAGGAGATAAGATAAAAGVASTLQTIGTVMAIGGSLAQGVSSYQTGKANAEMIGQQMQTEAQLNAVKDHRERLAFGSQIAQQRAELAARGVSMDSATAVFLGQTAAKEMAFNSQSIRSTGHARQSELTAQQRNSRAQGRLGLLKGGLSASGTLLSSQADKWAELEG